MTMLTLWFCSGADARRASDLLHLDRRRVHRIHRMEDDPAVAWWDATVCRGGPGGPPRPTHRLRCRASLVKDLPGGPAACELAVGDEVFLAR
jgi:hypothetical protein